MLEVPVWVEKFFEFVFLSTIAGPAVMRAVQFSKSTSELQTSTGWSSIRSVQTVLVISLCVQIICPCLIFASFSPGHDIGIMAQVNTLILIVLLFVSVMVFHNGFAVPAQRQQMLLHGALIGGLGMLLFVYE